MRIEVHVHGSLYLCKGVSLAQVESGLRKWLEYLDAENISEVRSLEQSEPGITFDRANRIVDVCWTGEVGRSFRRTLEETLQDIGPLTEHASEIELTYYHEDDRANRIVDVCWTGEVGRSFRRTLEETLQDIGPLTEHASEIELTYYHEDGRDEYQLLFVGPSPEAIHQAQRHRMVEDVAGLLSRHFDQQSVEQVTAVVNDLFDRDMAEKAAQAPDTPTDVEPAGSLVHFRRKHLH